MIAALLPWTAAAAGDSTPSWGFDLSGRNLTTAPGDDFYDYANGGWEKKAVIPRQGFRTGPWEQLEDQAEADTRRLIEEAGADPKNASRIALLYRAYMDTTTLDARGVAPLAAKLATLDAAKSKTELARAMGVSLFGFRASLFSIGIQPDAKAPQVYLADLDLVEPSLPGRDYYLEPKLAPTREAYRAYIERILALAQRPDPAGAAARILAFETAMAEASQTASKARDLTAAYNPTNVADLNRIAPGFPWPAFLDGAGLGQTRRLNLRAPASVAAVARLYEETPLETLLDWAAFHMADEAAPYLTPAWLDLHDRFHQVTLNGQQEPRERWRAAIDAVNTSLSGDVSKRYVARYLSPQTTKQVRAIAENVRLAFAARIRKLVWMSPSTKAEALKKLAAMSIEIGAPHSFTDYTGLNIQADDLFGDVERANAFRWTLRLHRLQGPVDRHSWIIPPQYVGAFNSGNLNLVAVDAAYLHAPFFDAKADPAINYGAVGATIGHEISHGFDDQGRRIDAQGALRDWWAPRDAARFQAEAGKLAAQYSAEEVLPGMHINGEQTLGESLADLGGLLLALDAYHLSLHGHPAPILDGYTGDERVFLGFAQSERAKEAESFVRSTLLTNSHSPPAARVNQSVRDVDGWYHAFHIKPGAPLYLLPSQRVHIW